MDLVV